MADFSSYSPFSANFGQGDPWQNLMRFGFATMAAGGQPGATFLGAMGQGGLNAMDYGMASSRNAAATALLGSEAGLYGAEAHGANIKNNVMIGQLNMQRQLYGLPPLNADGNVVQNVDMNTVPGTSQGGAPLGGMPPPSGAPQPQEATAPGGASAAPPQAPNPSSGSSQPYTPPGTTPAQAQSIRAGLATPPAQAAASGNYLPQVGDGGQPITGGQAIPTGATAAGAGPMGIPYAVWRGAVAPTRQQAAVMANVYSVMGNQTLAQRYNEYATKVEPGMQLNPDYTESYVPGSTADPRYVYQKTGAEKWAGVGPQEAVNNAMPRSMRGPGSALYFPSSGQFVQVPNEIDTVDPNSGAHYKQFVPLGLDISGPGGQQQTGPNFSGARLPTPRVPMPNNPPSVFNQPVNASGGGAPAQAPQQPASPQIRFQTQLGPLQEESMKTRGEELEKYGITLDDNATNAKNNNFLLDQMRNESQTWSMGKFADISQNANAYLLSFKDSLGIKDANLNTQVGDFQAFNKNAIELGRQAVRATSSRAAVQEFNMILGALPNAEMSNGGFLQIADQLQGINDYNIAKQAAAQAWRPQHGGTLDGFETDWNMKTSPGAFLVHRMDEGSLQAMYNKLNQTPQGRATIARLKTEVQYADQNGYFSQ